ncbi:MAG: ribosome maturation factor RimP [Ilumatobacteraceae bacterium]|nr:ribosome maturation factor RimP [Ilumatobacteraceae bacterium]
MSSSEIDRVQALVEPVASDLQLDLYDIERRGGTIRITLDTPPGSPAGVSLDTLSLATRQISRELDHEDPIAGRYTLEVTSPGLERALRTPAHFQREVGKDITVRLRDVEADERRVRGKLVAADDQAATILLDDGAEQVVSYDAIDKARTIFEWGPTPKQGGKNKSGKNKSGKKSGKKSSGIDKTSSKQTGTNVTKETQRS